MLYPYHVVVREDVLGVRVKSVFTIGIQSAANKLDSRKCFS